MRTRDLVAAPRDGRGPCSSRERRGPATAAKSWRDQPGRSRPGRSRPRRSQPRRSQPRRSQPAEITAREIPAREIPAREIPAREIPAAEITAGEIPAAEITAGKGPAGEGSTRKCTARAAAPVAALVAALAGGPACSTSRYARPMSRMRSRIRNPTCSLPGFLTPIRRVAWYSKTPRTASRPPRRRAAWSSPCLAWLRCRHAMAASWWRPCGRCPPDGCANWRLRGTDLPADDRNVVSAAVRGHHRQGLQATRSAAMGHRRWLSHCVTLRLDFVRWAHGSIRIDPHSVTIALRPPKGYGADVPM